MCCHTCLTIPKGREAADPKSCAELWVQPAIELGKLYALEGERQVVQV